MATLQRIIVRAGYDIDTILGQINTLEIDLGAMEAFGGVLRPGAKSNLDATIRWIQYTVGELERVKNDFTGYEMTKSNDAVVRLDSLHLLIYRIIEASNKKEAEEAQKGDK
ncbi:hypothetical protein GGR54DRAFT_644732 [Hypoxylon sp. NC1633]|nr:hypothetical protein GGR54DRAFT_644732 [Hypoxylon sp. NC1633]